jgi:CheY-like chemotaxis protein
VILAVCRSAERVALLAEAGRSRGYKVMPVVDPQDVLDALGSGRPAAVVIDLSLPDRAGWVTLDALKHGTRGRHLPVYTLARSAEAPLARRLGVIGHAAFPASVEAAERVIDAIGEFAGRRTRSALVVEADPARRRRVVELLATDGVEVVEAGSVEEALGAVRSAVFECIVLPPAIEEVPASALAERLSAAAGPRRAPFIVADLDRPSGARPGASGDEGQGDAPAHAAGEEELLEQACLFLHRSPASLTAEKRRLFEQALRHDPVLGDKHVIVVDDDVRNTFALTSLLERYGMRVTAAEGGAEALAALEDNPDVALVLMDVMMPDMDGYEAIRRIRALPQFAALPVVALTAKAMKEDREKCLAAGASDYITKPVDTEKLLALLRVWLLPTSRLDLATASVHAER